MPSREAAAPYQAIARLITAIGRDDFGAAAFDLVSREVQADHIVVQFVEGHRISGLFTQGKVLARIADAVNRRYLERYHMLDRSLSSFRDLGDGAPVVTRFDPKLNESPTYTTYFFERTGLCDKLSIVSNRGDSMVCCNLYRLEASGPFDERHVERAGQVAPVLMAALWRHAGEAGKVNLPSMKVGAEPGEAERQSLAALSQRELEVCKRLLAGASTEGVALDLGISPHTVRTLRKRLYKKLQVNSLGDLFARYLSVMSAVSSGER